MNVSREKDELISGLFLVRLSEKNNGYVITMMNNDAINNYKIEKNVSFEHNRIIIISIYNNKISQTGKICIH